MKATASLLSALLLFGCIARPAPPPGGGLVDALTWLHRAQPSNGVLVYLIAREQDRAGDLESTMSWLRRLEQMPWDYALDDADFPNASILPGYQALAARLALREPVEHPSVPFVTVDAIDLKPEGTGHDPVTGSFFLSSGRQRKVFRVDRSGRASDFSRPAEPILGTSGIAVDPKARVLWTAGGTPPFMENATEDEKGRAELYRFDLDSGELTGRYTLEVRPALLNDVAIASDGTVYATDTIHGSVWMVRPGSGRLERLLPDEAVESPNGIAVGADGATLYVAGLFGISRVEIATGEVSLLDNPAPVNLGGIDGLYARGGELIGVQNLVGRGRVWKIALDGKGEKIVSAEILDSNHPLYANPTTGVIAGNDFFYLANPRLQELLPDGSLSSPGSRRHVLLRLPL